MKKIFPRTLLIVAFIWVMNEAGKFMYESVTDDLVVTEADLEDKQGSIETLVLGNSVVHRGLDTNILNEDINTISFNIATSGQPLAASYLILKDEMKRNPIKRVFLGVNVAGLKTDQEMKDYTIKARVMKVLLSPLSKLQFLLTLEPDEIEIVLLCPARTENVLSLHKVKRNVSYKLSADFKNRNSYPGATATYYGYGFSNALIEYTPTEQDVYAKDYWDRNEAETCESKTYIEEISEICKKEGIEFNLVVFPCAPSYAVKQGDLADMDDFIETVAESASADLYNYNYTSREDIYDYLPDSAYLDVKHLNTNGAEIFTGLLTEDYIAAHE